MRIPIFLTVFLWGCVPFTGEGVSVTLQVCTAPVFVLDSNYCAETFIVEGPEGEVWRVEAGDPSNEFAPLCIGELTMGLTYGGLVVGSDASEADELLNGATYSYEASFESQLTMPETWSGSFTYDCPSAPSE